jgi:hypothetical protein
VDSYCKCQALRPMTKKQQNLEKQITVFMALRGHNPQNVDCEQVMREMMEEINHWRMVAKHPNATDKPRGGQRTAEMDRVRYQHLIGYLTGKHEINQQEAAIIIAERSMSISGRELKPKTILELASGWKKKHEFSKSSKLFDIPRWQRHEEMLDELMEMFGDPDYFPEQIANYCKPN